MPSAIVTVTPLKTISDERGFLMECLRNDDPHFTKFGQAYISAVRNGVVKGWHYHNFQTDQIVCVKGHIKLVCFDNRTESTSSFKDRCQEIVIGDRNPCIVTIPNGVWHGWKGLDEGLNLVLNMPDVPYNREAPDEVRADPLDKSPYAPRCCCYNWDVKWK